MAKIVPAVVTSIGLILVFAQTALGLLNVQLLPPWVSGIGAVGVIAGSAMYLIGRTK